MINFNDIILNSTGARSIKDSELIQELWSGYGKIIRVYLEDADKNSVIAKHVHPPQKNKHPRGWGSDLGHQRKLRSYQVESHWYANYSKVSSARLPKCIALEQYDGEMMMVLEDLDEAGYPLRKRSLRWEEIDACLKWLATFHASYLDHSPDGLWEIGSYWHLNTRPHELSVLTDKTLKEAATAIDDKLNSCHHKTIIHGDAKLANFCFATDGQVAGVDFQYVGGGCGMKDVIYFVGSCLQEKDCERLEDQILETYFNYLQYQLPKRNKALEREWRALYRVAWADFHRFIKGWSPGHWKINSYSERITQEVIKDL